jgi:ABC-type branched-subunit amino acid transport system permease subunit
VVDKFKSLLIFRIFAKNIHHLFGGEGGVGGIHSMNLFEYQGNKKLANQENGWYLIELTLLVELKNKS